MYTNRAVLHPSRSIEAAADRPRRGRLQAERGRHREHANRSATQQRADLLCVENVIL